jgi:hypothetical protein
LAEQGLDHADVDILFEQMGGEAVIGLTVLILAIGRLFWRMAHHDMHDNHLNRSKRRTIRPFGRPWPARRSLCLSFSNPSLSMRVVPSSPYDRRTKKEHQLLAGRSRLISMGL